MNKMSKQKQNYKTNKEKYHAYQRDSGRERERACDQSGEKGYEEKEKFKTIIIIIVVVLLLVVVVIVIVVQTRLRAVTRKTLSKTKRQMK